MKGVAVPLLVLLLTACAPPPEPLPLPAAEVLLQQARTGGQDILALKGMARLEVRVGERSSSTRQALVLQRPDRLRADLIVPFGPPPLQIGIRDGHLAAYSPVRREVLTGEATAANLARLLGLPLPLEDVLALVVRDIPLAAHDGLRTEWQEGQPALLLEQGGRLRQRLVFDAAGRVVSALWRDVDSDAVELAVRYGDFTEADPPFARRISLEMPALQAQVELQFSQVTLNPSLSGDPFRLHWPAETRVIPLSSLDGG